MSDDIDLEIPDFLKRHKGEVLPPWKPNPCAPAQVAEERWREMERERAERKAIKSRGRVAKMLNVRADRAAAAAGKKWDPVQGRVAMMDDPEKDILVALRQHATLTSMMRQMTEDQEKIANASLHQRAALMAEIERLQAENAAMNAVGAQLLEALSDISELVENKVDIDANGHANLAMQILTIVQLALEKR